MKNWFNSMKRWQFCLALSLSVALVATPLFSLCICRSSCIFVNVRCSSGSPGWTRGCGA